MRKTFSKKDIKQFLELHPNAEQFMDKKSQVIQEDDKLFLDKELVYRQYDNTWIPSLELLRKEKNLIPKIVVDKGTPPYIAKGADLMRPGVVSCDVFQAGEVIVIVDEVHGFPLATGKPLYDSKELMQQEKGKVVQIIHNLNTE